MSGRTPGSAHGAAKQRLVRVALVFASLWELLLSTSSRALKKSKQVSSLRLAADEVGILKKMISAALNPNTQAAAWTGFRQLFEAAQGLTQLPATEALGQLADLLRRHLTPDDLKILVDEGLVDGASVPTAHATVRLEDLMERSNAAPTLESIEKLVEVGTPTLLTPLPLPFRRQQAPTS